MDIMRILPNISSSKMDESKEFYLNFLGLKLVMDMQWILTFASPSNHTAQINIVKTEDIFIPNNHITISIEVTSVEGLYERAQQLDYNIIYPLTNEAWGVRRFWVKDPNGVTINLLAHNQT